MNLTTKKLIGKNAIVAAAIGLVAILIFIQCRDQPGEEKLGEAPENFLNLGDSATYVGPEACGACHADKLKSFSHNPMSQSWRRGSAQMSTADINGDAVFDPSLGTGYSMLSDNGQLKIHEFLLNRSDTIYNRFTDVDYIVGSGHHTNSHVRSSNGYLYQVPLTWYAQQRQWNLPPGFENGHNTRFSRALNSEGLSCHNAVADHEPKSLNKYYKVPLGIDCERCHGPGSIHIAAKNRGEVIDTSKYRDWSIVNPRRLPFALQIDVCQRCHLQGDAVLKAGKTWYSHQPGMPLSHVMDVFLPTFEGEDAGFLMASHAERLRKSPCFVASAEKLTCITCHNPHPKTEVSGKQVYIAQCQNCHMAAHPPVRLQEGDDCITCHMPTTGAVDIPHVSITDHNIRVVKDKLVFGKQNFKFKGLVSMVNPFASDSAVATGYLFYHEKFVGRKEYLDSAKKYIDRISQPSANLLIHYYYLRGEYQEVASASKRGYGALSPLAYYQLGQSQQNLGRINEALKSYGEAVRMMPFQLDYRAHLGNAFLQARNIADARLQFEFMANEDPTYPSAWNGLGFCALAIGDIAQAENFIAKALALDPFDPSIIINHSKVLIATGKVDKALMQLKQLAKTHPSPEVASLINLISSQPK